MGELTEQEKLERRRQKRQQRILQAGESRLNKITGTAFPNRVSPTPSPSSSSKPVRRASEDPSDELGAPPPVMDTMMPPMASMFGQPPLGDPMEQLFSQQGFNPASMFANLANEQPPPLVDTSAKYWNLLHFVMMISLGVYAVYTEWTRAGSERLAALLYDPVTRYPSVHVPLFWYFVTLELGLQSARLFYHQGTMPSQSTLAQIATQLPHPIGTVATVFLRYRLIFACLVQDICVLVFIIGLAQVISNAINY
ncbi:hypothetical protein CU098_004075 [Rhizopus stolonifer]|uniref:Golgi to ER traffic protein 2 n=1 Tax=Rhizopus stolonifer TaxID=4846 RepID=A0A367KW99_RHIST|nr:hypothetical protein CU098_004075 [Rhizopus stolonifer]